MKPLIALFLVLAGLAVSIACLASMVDNTTITLHAPNVSSGQAAATSIAGPTADYIPIDAVSQKPRLISQTVKFERGEDITTESSYTTRIFATVTSVYECDSVTSMK